MSLKHCKHSDYAACYECLDWDVLTIPYIKFPLKKEDIQPMLKMLYTNKQTLEELINSTQVTIDRVQECGRIYKEECK